MPCRALCEASKKWADTATLLGGGIGGTGSPYLDFFLDYLTCFGGAERSGGGSVRNCEFGSGSWNGLRIVPKL